MFWELVINLMKEKKKCPKKVKNKNKDRNKKGGFQFGDSFEKFLLIKSTVLDTESLTGM